MFGLKAYPTPIVKPLWPFMAASVIVFFGVNALQTSATSTELAKRDPKNPYALKGGAAHAEEH